MKNQTEMEAYARMRLMAWGHEFRLGRDAQWLGYPRQSVLHALIVYQGEIPMHAGARKPLTVDPDVMEIEEFVRIIHADMPEAACVLRAHYCGSGRAAKERRVTAGALFGAPLTRHGYFALHDIGFQRIAGALALSARIAA